MGLANCPECGKLYLENPRRLCPDCQAREDEFEEKITNFLRKVDNATVEEIYEATGVPMKVIIKMVQRGRLVGSAQITYPCETCGAPITQGRVCPNCMKNITGESPQPKDWQPPEHNLESEHQRRRMYSKEPFRR